MQRALLGLCLFASPAALAAPLPDLALTVKAKQQGCSAKVDFFITVKNLSTDAAADPQQTGGKYIDLILIGDSAGQPDPYNVDPIPDEIYQWDALGLGPGEESAPFVWTHDYQVPGKYHAWIMVDSISFVKGLETAGLPELDKANNIEDLVIDVSCVTADAPDLVLTDLVATVNGPLVSYKVTVKNVGTVDVTTPFLIDVKWDTGGVCPPPEWTNPAVTATGDTWTTVAGLAKGVEQTYDILPPLAPGPGVHKSCAAVDVEHSIAEKSESNNFFGPVTVEVADVPLQKKCDLAVVDFDVAVLGSAVTYAATVQNVGDAACSPAQMEVYYHVPTEPAAVEAGDFVFDVPTLGPGASADFSHVRDPALNGGQHAWLWVDRKDDAIELEEKANNLLGPYNYQVLVAGDAPDLVVTGVTWKVVGTSIEYNVTIKNVGTAGAEDAEVDVFYDFATNPNCYTDAISGPGHDLVHVTLASGEETTTTTVWEKPTSGNHTGWVKIDCLNQLKEADDTNNDYGPVYTAIDIQQTDGVDLVVVDFKAKVTCTTVHYLTVIENQGDEPSGKFAAVMYWDKDVTPIPGVDVTGDSSFFYDGLEPGGQIVLETKNTGAESKKYHSWVMIDAQNEVSETEEGNNIGTATEIVVDAIACGCPANVQILEACACGAETVTEGYCCNGGWQIDPHGSCEDSPGGDADAGGAESGGDLPHINTDALFVGTGVISSNGQLLTESGGGCAAAPTPGGAWLLVFLALIGLRSVRRRAR